MEIHAANTLRSLPRHLQRHVLDRGSLMGARDPSAVLLSRVRDVMMSSAQSMPKMPMVTMTLANGQEAMPFMINVMSSFILTTSCFVQHDTITYIYIHNYNMI